MTPPPDADRRAFDEAMAFLSSFTDYEQILHRAPSRTTFDLGRLTRLLARLDDPHRGRPVIHVTGTKGKGSVTMMADALLRAHGWRTLRFLSPHVERIHERLAVDGTSVSDRVFADLVDELRPQLARIEREAPADLPSFFEVMTIMGFLLARNSHVDALVLEVGLGGRLDATNVVEPTVSVITSIGLDHTRILGKTLEAIAFEKAGIIKQGRPVITGVPPGHPGFAVIRDRARDLGSPLLFPGEGLELGPCRPSMDRERGARIDFGGRAGDFTAEGFEFHAGQPHQGWNALLALAAVELTLETRGERLDAGLSREALAQLRLPARCEWFPGSPPVLLDGAHTRESIAALAPVAQALRGGGPLVLLCGLTRDREPAEVFEPLLPLDAIVATELPTPRSLPASELGEALRAADFAPTEVARDPIRGLGASRELAGPCGLVLIVGSLYLAGVIRPGLLST